MTTLILRGGGEVFGVAVGAETVMRARVRGEEWLHLTWQPGFTPNDPSSFTLDVLVEEIVAIKVGGR